MQIATVDALTAQWQAFVATMNGADPIVSWDQGLAAATLAARIADGRCAS